MTCFAVMLQSEPASPQAILLLVDERPAADEIAMELRGKGLAVDVREVREPDEAAAGSPR